MMRRIRRQGAQPVSCDAVRQAVSAALDGEPPGVGARKGRAHLRRCEECRQFQAGLPALMGSTRLVGSRPVPVDLKAVLAAELSRTAGPPVTGGVERRRAPRVGWGRPARWAGAVVPAIALAVLVPFGAFSSATGKPTHAATPCTVNLHP
jgi:predicted anti-sigma-YlaC factor YlaD